MSTSATVANSPGGPPSGASAPLASPAPLSGLPLIAGTLALSAATFMVILDTSIANVSIPAISGDVGVSTSQGTWVITSFAVSNAIAVPLTGWLTQRFGSVRLFLLSALLFVVFSWLCGLAPNIETLIAFRVLQGLFAGPLIPLSQALAAIELSARKGGHRPGHVVHDDADRPGRGSAPRWLDHRQLLVAVDLLHQRSRRPLGGIPDVEYLPSSRDADAQAARSIRSAWRCS